MGRRRIGLQMVSVTCRSYGSVVLDLADGRGGPLEVIRIFGGVLGDLADVFVFTHFIINRYILVSLIKLSRLVDGI